MLKEFENYKVAIVLNDTHFSCDDGENILDLDKFNDDFCDCRDGSDENSNFIIEFNQRSYIISYSIYFTFMIF